MTPSHNAAVSQPTRLSRHQADAILELARTATESDGVAPLNEASTLAVERLSNHDAHTSDAPARVWVAESLDTAQDGSPLSATRGRPSQQPKIVGVLVDPDGTGVGADVVVAPKSRRQGIGTDLVAALTSGARHSETSSTTQEFAGRAPAQVSVWAHGDLEPARNFARARGFAAVRDLWKMSRPLSADETFDVALPDGFEARPFDGSPRQAQAWLEVNAAAFAYHPEQGRMTLDDFHERTKESWFDPAGLILVWDVTADTEVLAASHWVKLEPANDAPSDETLSDKTLSYEGHNEDEGRNDDVPADVHGEVYVVAVSPSYQGRGLARPLTALGLRQLQRAGATTVDLYVEGDNEPAKATYVRSGFSQSAHDAMYRLESHGKSATKHHD